MLTQRVGAPPFRIGQTCEFHDLRGRQLRYRYIITLCHLACKRNQEDCSALSVRLCVGLTMIILENEVLLSMCKDGTSCTETIRTTRGCSEQNGCWWIGTTMIPDKLMEEDARLSTKVRLECTSPPHPLRSDRPVALRLAPSMEENISRIHNVRALPQHTEG